jgi:ribonuclease HIII
VAAASILARNEFVNRIARLSQEYGVTLPKGASAEVIKAGKIFVEKHGKADLANVAKLHFKRLKNYKNITRLADIQNYIFIIYKTYGFG